MITLNFCMAKETTELTENAASLAKELLRRGQNRVNIYTIQRADKSARRGRMTLRTNEQRIHMGNSQAVASKRPNR